MTILIDVNVCKLQVLHNIVDKLLVLHKNSGQHITSQNTLHYKVFITQDTLQQFPVHILLHARGNINFEEYLLHKIKHQYNKKNQ